MFNILIGKPGSGKSLSIKTVDSLWRATGVLNLGPHTITSASLVDVLVEAADKQRKIGDAIQAQSSVLFGVGEFANLVSGYDQALLSRLAALYDAEPEFVSRTRGGGEKHIPFPSVYLLAGVTPDQFNDTIPETAWKQGFMSRVILVYTPYTGHPSRDELFPEDDDENAKEIPPDITRDLKLVTNLYGRMRYDKAATDAYMDWVDCGYQPVPTQPRLLTYNSRRGVHVWKISMALAAAELSLDIRLEHFQRAKNYLIEAEEAMSDAFTEMASSSDSQAIKAVFNWLIMATARQPGGVTNAQLRHALSNHVATYQIDTMISHMTATGMIIGKPLAGEGLRYFAGEIPR